MWKLIIVLILTILQISSIAASPKTGDELVDSVLTNCIEMDCVKRNVLDYLDNLLKIDNEQRSLKNIDMAIFKRAAKVLKTHEIRMKLPQLLFDQTEIVYNPKTGLDIATPADNESRGLLKKKLFLPLLLLLKLKMKALMPIVVMLIGLKSMKALILSKLAIVIVLGFIIYQFFGKSGMAMPMSMAPIEPPSPPSSMYGAPAGPSTPSSYEPGWEPNQGGPYARVWTNSDSSNSHNDAQNLAYSAYYPGAASSTTNRP